MGPWDPARSAPRGGRFWPLPLHLSNRMGQWAGSRASHTTKGFPGLPMGTAWTPGHSDTHSPCPGGCAHSSTWDPSPWSAHKTDTSSCICWAFTGHQTARSALYSTCDTGVVSVPMLQRRKLSPRKAGSGHRQPRGGGHFRSQPAGEAGWAPGGPGTAVRACLPSSPQD